MNRRRFVGTVAIGLLIAPLTVDAQPAGKIYRIGLLGLGEQPDSGYKLTSFERGLSELGWIEGQNILIEARWAQNPDQLPILAAELVALNVDVIVTTSSPAALAAKKATALIPIVMAGSSNPVERGLVKSLARPGGNVTGMTNNLGVGFHSKMVQLLKETAPRVSRVAVLWSAGEEMVLREIQAAAPKLAPTVIDAGAREPDQVVAVLAAAMQAHADGLFVTPSPLNFDQRKVIADFTITNRLPSISGNQAFVSAGCLMSYWTDWVELRRQSARYVDKILKGANPSDLPVEQPNKLELVINLKTAKVLGLTIPQSVLLSADKLIE